MTFEWINLCAKTIFTYFTFSIVYRCCIFTNIFSFFTCKILNTGRFTFCILVFSRLTINTRYSIFCITKCTYITFFTFSIFFQRIYAFYFFTRRTFFFQFTSCLFYFILVSIIRTSYTIQCIFHITVRTFWAEITFSIVFIISIG